MSVFESTGSIIRSEIIVPLGTETSRVVGAVGAGGSSAIGVGTGTGAGTGADATGTGAGADGVGTGTGADEDGTGAGIVEATFGAGATGSAALTAGVFFAGLTGVGAMGSRTFDFGSSGTADGTLSASEEVVIVSAFATLAGGSDGREQDVRSSSPRTMTLPAEWTRLLMFSPFKTVFTFSQTDVRPQVLKKSIIRAMNLLKLPEAAELLNISYPTIKQWIYKGRIQSVRGPGGHHRIPASEIARLTQIKATRRREKPGVLETISGRNKLWGTVESVHHDGLLAEVKLNVGGQIITAIITSQSCKDLGLKRGVEAYALMKSTEVMVVRP